MTNKFVSFQNFDLICRFCMKYELMLKPIFQEGDDEDEEVHSDFSGNTVASVQAMLAACCTDVLVEENDGLPMFMCNSCLDKLIQSYEFRKQCLESQSFLHEIKSKYEENPTQYYEDDEDDDRAGSFFEEHFQSNNEEQYNLDINKFSTPDHLSNLFSNVTEDCGSSSTTNKKAAPIFLKISKRPEKILQKSIDKNYIIHLSNKHKISLPDKPYKCRRSLLRKNEDTSYETLFLTCENR